MLTGLKNLKGSMNASCDNAESRLSFARERSARAFLKRQLHCFELLLGLLRGLQVFLCCRERFVAEPGLYGPHVNACSQPARGGGVAKTVKVPFPGIESGAFGDLFAAVVQKSVVEMALRR